MSKPHTCTDPKHHVHDAEDFVSAVGRACNERGLRLTPIRARVLQLVADAGKPIKAYDLLERVRDGEGAGAAAPPTVYRALDFLMDRLATYLGATGVIANKLEFKDGHATGRLLRPVVAGPEKARLVREHARAKGHDLDECFAYSDSYSDVPMLSVVGHPAAVNPDTKLTRLAKAYGWPILNLERPA